MRWAVRRTHIFIFSACLAFGLAGCWALAAAAIGRCLGRLARACKRALYKVFIIGLAAGHATLLFNGSATGS